jgi:hypothetical protein
MYADENDGYLPPANLQFNSEAHFKAGHEKTFPHFLEKNILI